MNWQTFLLLSLILPSYSQNIILIRDYFLYKQVGTLVGFSCGDIENDHRAVRMLNDVGISASIKPLGSNVSVMQLLTSKYSRLGVFMDFTCSSSEDAARVINETSGNNVYGHLHNWLIMGRNITDTIAILDDRNFSIATELTISSPNNDDYDLYDVFNHCQHCGGSLHVTKLGTWNRNTGLNVTLLDDKISRRWDFRGIKVIMGGIVLNRPQNVGLIEYLEDEQNKNADVWSKFGFSIMTMIGEMFNFNFRLVEFTHWEKNEKNGPLMSCLKNKTVDLGFYPSIITTERLDYGNVVTQVWPTRTCFMFLTTTSLEMDMNIIIRPFAMNAWYTIAFLLIVMVVVLTVISKFEDFERGSDYGSTILITVAALCQQGLPFFANQWPSRIAFLQILFFGLLVYNYYSAAVVSSRLNAPLNKMNDSLYSLVQSRMHLATQAITFIPLLLRNPLPEVQYFKAHWLKIPENQRTLPIDVGVQKMTHAGFAYHGDPTDVYPLIERTFSKQMICQLTEVHLLRPCEIAVWSTRNGHFLEITKIGLIRVATSGLKRREVQRWSSRTPYCEKDKLYVSSVTIKEVGPILIVFICGMIASIVIVFLEYIVFHVAQRKKLKAAIKKRLFKKTLRKKVPAAILLNKQI